MTVLIKVVTCALDAKKTRNFFKEMVTWVDLQDHDNILQLYYMHKIDSTVYVVYEHMGKV